MPTTPVLVTPMPLPTPIVLPTQTPTSNPKPSLTPTPKPSLTPNPVLTPRPTTPPSTLSVKDFIMNQINEYRRSQGLGAVKTDPYTCSFAKTRALEISKSFNHDGFSQRVNSKSLPYPSYSAVTENITMNGNYKDVVPKWIASPGHAENMRKDTPLVCVEQYGNFFAYEGWKP